MFYVKLGLSLYSHTKVSLLNIGKNSIVACEQYFSTQESFTNNSFIITESRNADIDFLSHFSLQSRRIWGYDKGHNSMPPSWMIKLKEGWGEAKKDSEGEDDGLKKEEGEGERRGKNRPSPLLH